VADGLAYLDIGSHKGTEFLADFGHNFTARPVFQFKGSLDFRSVDAQRVFVQFGAAGLARYSLDFGHGEQQLLGTAADGVALFQRDARQRGDVDGERPFVERGQERAAQGEEQTQCDGEEGDGTTQYGTLVLQGFFEHCAVGVL